MNPIASYRKPRSKLSTTVVAPVRVNLVGEHTDYTGALVMPMAIPLYTTVRLQCAHQPAYFFDSEIFVTRITPVESSCRRLENGATTCVREARDDPGTSCEEVGSLVYAALDGRSDICLAA